MAKRYNAADYNLVANPSLSKTNSPWPLWITLLLCAVLLAVLWTYFTPDIRLTRPAITHSAGQITATTQATNRTSVPVTLDIRIIIGTKGIDSDFGSGQFYPLAQQDVSGTIPPRSTQPLFCTFTISSGGIPTHAEVQLLTTR